MDGNSKSLELSANNLLIVFLFFFFQMSHKIYDLCYVTRRYNAAVVIHCDFMLKLSIVFFLFFIYCF